MVQEAVSVDLIAGSEPQTDSKQKVSAQKTLRTQLSMPDQSLMLKVMLLAVSMLCSREPATLL